MTCIGCRTESCRDCKHYAINGRPFCGACAAPYLKKEGLFDGGGKFLLKLLGMAAISLFVLLFFPGILFKLIGGFVVLSLYMKHVMLAGYGTAGTRVEEVIAGQRRELSV